MNGRAVVLLVAVAAGSLVPAVALAGGSCEPPPGREIHWPGRETYTTGGRRAITMKVWSQLQSLIRIQCSAPAKETLNWEATEHGYYPPPDHPIEGSSVLRVSHSPTDSRWGPDGWGRKKTFSRVIYYSPIFDPVRYEPYGKKGPVAFRLNVTWQLERNWTPWSRVMSWWESDIAITSCLFTRGFRDMDPEGKVLWDTSFKDSSEKDDHNLYYRWATSVEEAVAFTLFHEIAHHAGVGSDEGADRYAREMVLEYRAWKRGRTTYFYIPEPDHAETGSISCMECSGVGVPPPASDPPY